MARTDTLGNFLTDVADAIREKKGTSETIQASEFDTEIANLPSGGEDVGEYLDLEPESIISNTNYPWWQTKLALPKISNLKVIIPSSAKTTNYLFYNCKWYYIPKIIKIEDNLSSMNFMFSGCSNLQTINLESLNMTNIERVNNAFTQCTNLKEIIFGNQTIGKIISASQWFAGCSSLERLDARGVDFTNITTFVYAFNSVPETCEIIVKDQTQKDWFATNFSNLTNVKTVAEYEAE